MAHRDFQDARAEPLERLGALGGDGALRQLAADEAVECHGVLWLLDEMHDAAVVSIRQLYEGLLLQNIHVAVFPGPKSAVVWPTTPSACVSE